MNNYTLSDINNSKHNKICNQLWTLDDKPLVIIDKSIIEKLNIIDISTIFLKQEVLNDNTNLMQIKKF